MDDQFSIGSTDLSFAAFHQWNQCICNLMVGAEFDPFERTFMTWKPFVLQIIVSITFPTELLVALSRGLIIRWQPNGLVICIQIKPGLIKGCNVMPMSVLLSPQYR
jgi:hypothetical protein